MNSPSRNPRGCRARPRAWKTPQARRHQQGERDAELQEEIREGDRKDIAKARKKLAEAQKELAAAKAELQR